MRTTVTLDDDVAAAVQRLRHERQIGLSAALNILARAGMLPARQPARPESHFTPAALGMRIDVSNVAEVLDHLDATDGVQQ